MDIKYKIIKVTPVDHAIVVRFYSDTISEEDLAIRDTATGEITLDADGNIESCRTDYSITLWDVPVLTGKVLEEEICRHAPTQWLELLGKVSDASVDTSLNSCVELIGQEVVFEPPEIPELPELPEPSS